METLPADVVRHEILPRAREYVPALRAVCRAWHDGVASRSLGRSRKTAARGLKFLAGRGHTELILWVKDLRGREFQTAQLNNMLKAAAGGGHAALVQTLCDWGAAEFAAAMPKAARRCPKPRGEGTLKFCSS